MPHAKQRLAPWSDWTPMHHESAIWFTTGGVYGPLAAGDFARDQLDATAGADFAGGASPKPTFARPTAQSSPQRTVWGFWRNIKLPDFTIGRDQAARGAAWTGLSDEAMTDNGRRVAIQIEHVLASRSAADAIGADLTGFAVAIKYKGFGGALLAATGSGAIDDDTEDAVISATVLGPTTNIAAGTYGAFNGAGVTEFPDMALPGDTNSDDPNGAPSFNDNGVARIQCVVEIPSTVYPGTIIEVLQLMQLPIEAAGVAVQWQYASYRWLKGGPEASYPWFPANQALQLDGGTDARPLEQEQPYIDGENENP